MDVALFTGFALAIRPNETGALFVTACLSLAATAALAMFGYAWNDACDSAADARARKVRPSFRHSRSVALVALGAAATLFAAAAHLDPLLLALGFTAVTLPWAYSGPPIRLKERGVLGLIAGALAQRAVPAVFVAAALEVPARYAMPWLAWMTCWGLRGMIVHQAHDAHADRVAGLTTWGATREDVRLNARRLARWLVPLELACFCAAVTPLFTHAAVRIAAMVALAAWALLKAGTIWRFHAGSVRIDWLSFRSMPLADLYSVFAPALVATALARSGSWFAWAWITVDATVRLPALRKTWRRIVSLATATLVAPAQLERFGRQRRQ